MVELFARSRRSTSCSPARRPSTGAASCSRSARRSAPTPPTTTIRARPTASARSRCEQYLLGEHAATGLPATVLRVAHTLGPMSPLASPRPDLLRPARGGPADPHPRRGLPVRPPRARRRRRRLDGVDRRQRRCRRADLQRRRRRDHEHPRGRADDGQGGRRRARDRQRPARHRPDAHPPLVHWGEGLVGGIVFSIDKALAELDWRPQYGLEDGYRQSYEWFAAAGETATSSTSPPTTPCSPASVEQRRGVNRADAGEAPAMASAARITAAAV